MRTLLVAALAAGAVLALAPPCAPAAGAVAPSATAPDTSAHASGKGAAATASPAPAAPAPSEPDDYLQIDGPAGARITLDDRPRGPLPLAGPIALEPGNHLLEGKLRGYLPYRQEVSFTSGGDRRLLQMRLVPLSRRDAVLYSFVLAGLGESYVGRPLEGYVLSAAEVGGLLAALAGQLTYTNRRSDYLLLYDAYQHAVAESDVTAQRAAAASAFQKMKDAQSLRNAGLVVAAGAIVVGARDVWLRFPSIEAGPGMTPRAREVGRAGPADPAAAHVAWNLRF